MRASIGEIEMASAHLAKRSMMVKRYVYLSEWGEGTHNVNVNHQKTSERRAQGKLGMRVAVNFLLLTDEAKFGSPADIFIYSGQNVMLRDSLLCSPGHWI